MTFEVRDEDLRGLHLSPEKLKIKAAVGLYAGEDITLGQAAALAGLSQSEFLQELGRHHIHIHYGVEDFENDLQTLEKLGRISPA